MRNPIPANESSTDIIMLDEETVDDKENNEITVSTGRSTRSSLKRLSSPSLEHMSLDDSTRASDTPGATRSHMSAKRRKVKIATPKTEPKPRAARQRLHLPICECLQSRVIGFQVGVFKTLAGYSKMRERMMLLVKGLVQTRLKIKETTQILTNSDNLHLQPTQTVSLICPELHSTENNKEEKNRNEFYSELTNCLNLLKKLQKSLGQSEKEEIDQFLHDKPLKKQLYDCIDLLAHLFGFFGHILYRIDALRLKMDILSFEKAKLPSSPIPATKSIVSVDVSNYSQTIINLAKAYLSANMCDAFEQLNEEIIGEKIKTDDRKLAGAEKLLLKIETNKFIGSKPETLVAYQLVLMHYFILKRRFGEAILVMKEKVFKSSITTGKQTAYYYETRCYLKYLQFIMLMVNLEKHEAEMSKLIEEEIPLSLLEEAYVAAFSVARHYVVNAIEPHRTFSNSIIQSNKLSATVASAAAASATDVTTTANPVLPIAASSNSLASMTTPCKPNAIAEQTSSKSASEPAKPANASNDDSVFFGNENKQFFKNL